MDRLLWNSAASLSCPGASRIIFRSQFHCQLLEKACKVRHQLLFLRSNGCLALGICFRLLAGHYTVQSGLSLTVLCVLQVPLLPHQKHALAWLLWRENQNPQGGILGKYPGPSVGCDLPDCYMSLGVVLLSPYQSSVTSLPLCAGQWKL